MGDEVVLTGRTTGSHLRLLRLEEFKDPIVWVAKIRDDRGVTEWRLYPNTDEFHIALGLTEETRVA